MAKGEGIGIEGIQELQKANQELMAKFKPGGAFSQVIWQVTMSLHRYAVSITHVASGALRASHRDEMIGDFIGYIWIDPSTVNPSGQAPAEYGPGEEERGGEHAFYMRTIDEDAQSSIEAAIIGLDLS